ncbi:hypothetical protein V8C86DRAFT_2469334 [Haematococcus lacustris]
MTKNWAVPAALVLAFLALALSVVSQSADPDPFTGALAWLQDFGSMTQRQQNMALFGVGVAIQSRTGMDCNIFGGALACKHLSSISNSSYVKECGLKGQQTVDCAFYQEVLGNVYDSPVDNLEEYLASGPGGRDVRALCPQCFDSVQALWCALAVPECGTFAGLTQSGLVPLMAQAAQAYSSGLAATRVDALSSIMADVLDTALLGLPCREMCEAVTSRCSCTPGNETLGSLVEWLATQPQLAGVRRVPQWYGRTMFRKVWTRPFCSLFPLSSEEGFTGECHLPPRSSVPGGAASSGPGGYCSSPAAWCAASSDGSTPDTSKYIQSLLMLQLMRAMTGWLTDDNAVIWGAHKNIGEAVGRVAAAEHSGGGSAAPMSGGQVAGIVFLSLFAAAGLVAGLVAGWVWWRRQGSSHKYAELGDEQGMVSLLGGPTKPMPA